MECLKQFGPKKVQMEIALRAGIYNINNANVASKLGKDFYNEGYTGKSPQQVVNLIKREMDLANKMKKTGRASVKASVKRKS